MSKLTFFQLLTTVFLLVNCTSTTSNDVETNKKENTYHTEIKLEKFSSVKVQNENDKSRDEQDSLRILNQLEYALTLAKKHIKDNQFSFKTDSITIEIGHLFFPNTKHLLIKRSSEYGFYSNVYRIDNNTFFPVLTFEMAALAFIGDTLQDINGDKRLDYVFQWYPMSGCCERNIYDVYLSTSNGDFSKEFEFMNPVFDAKNKFIRGRCYGQSPPVYKFQWKGIKLDTIEFIHLPEETKLNYYLKNKSEIDIKEGLKLKKLPDEYKKL